MMFAVDVLDSKQKGKSQKESEAGVGSTATELSPETSRNLLELIHRTTDSTITLFYSLPGQIPGSLGDVRATEIHAPHQSEPCLQKRVDGSVDLIRFTLFARASDTEGEKCWKDCFGNSYASVTTQDSNGRMIKEISILPKINLSPDSTNNTSQVSLDLSALGFGRLDNILSMKTPQFIGNIGGEKQYQVYGDINAESRQAFTSGLGAIASGASSAENLFGFKPGTFLRKVVVYSSAEEYGYFDLKDPDTINITTGLLKSRAIQLTAFNETTHLIDNQFGLTKGEIEKFTLSLSRSREGRTFIYEMREDKFLSYSGITNFGHDLNDSINSPDVMRTLPQELFGAFIVSLRHPNWEGKMRTMSSDFKERYLKLLDIVERKLLKTQSENPSFNPILLRRLVQERRSALAKVHLIV